MTMSFNNVPGCCTAYILVGLGNENDVLDQASADSKVKFAAENMSNAQGFAIIMAITTAKQKTGVEVLKQIGFTPSTEAKKDSDYGRHRETGGLTVWTLPQTEWAKFQKEYKVRPRPVVVSEEELARRQALPEMTRARISTYMESIRVSPISIHYRVNADSPQFIYHNGYLTDGYQLSSFTHKAEFLKAMTAHFGVPFRFSPVANPTVGQMLEAAKEWRLGYRA